MATTFDTDKYYRDEEWRDAIDPSKNHYERLGLRFEDYPSTDDITDDIKKSFQQRYEWWLAVSRQYSANPANTKTEDTGPNSKKAIKELQKAKSILSDSASKATYDKQLKDELDKKAEAQFIPFIHHALEDNKISQEEKRNLLKTADKLKITGNRAEEIILSEMGKTGAKYKAEKTATASETFTNYYEVLIISQTANNSEIEEAFKKQYSIWNTRVHSPKFKDDVPKMKKLLQKAHNTLLDSDMRNEYDRQLKETLETPISPTGGEPPRLKVSKTEPFNFPKMRKGATDSGSFSIINEGIGILSGPIKTTTKTGKKWLKVRQSSIDTTRNKQDITFYINTSGLPFSLKDTGIIEIQSNGGTKEVSVNISVEMPEADLTRFSNGLTTGGLILGGLFGFLIYNLNLVEGMSSNVAGLAGVLALIGAVIVGGILGYKDKDESADAFAWGCGTLVVGFIVLFILQEYIPHAFSTVVWALTYGSLTNIYSRPIRRALWRGDQKTPIVAGVVALALTIGIIITGFEAAKEENKAVFGKQKTLHRAMQEVTSKLPGEWHGKVGNSSAKLFITQKANKLSGKMVYQSVEERLSAELKHNKGQIILVFKGTGYKILRGKGGFNLDTFYGALSTDGRSITGNYEDTTGHKGKWFVYKLMPSGGQTSGKPLKVRVTSNIRFGPGTNYPVMNVVSKGATLYMLDEHGGWYKVKLQSGEIGFISKKLVREKKQKYSLKPKKVAGKRSASKIKELKYTGGEIGFTRKKLVREKKQKYSLKPKKVAGKRSASKIKELKYTDGSKYIGTAVAGKKHGQGTHTYASGAKYVGNWKDDNRHGQGTYTRPDGTKYYVGNWKDGKKHGQGTLTFASGAKYVGNWKDDNRHGQGTLTFASGGKYVGNWKDGKRHGRGTYTSSDGENYVGNWENGKKHGQGTLTFASGKKYVGEYKDNRPSGGWFYGSNGNKTWSHKDSKGKWVHSPYYFP